MWQLSDWSGVDGVRMEGYENVTCGRVSYRIRGWWIGRSWRQAAWFDRHARFSILSAFSRVAGGAAGGAGGDS